MFEIPAKKCASIWKSEQYKQPEFREQLNTTTNRLNQVAYEPELVDRMRVQEFNNQKSNISEYANALNRGRVFINPTLSSC